MTHGLRRGLASKVTVCTDDDEVEKAKASTGSVVYFTASWCGPCRMISPVFEELASNAPDGTTFLKVDVDDFPEAAAGALVCARGTHKYDRCALCCVVLTPVLDIRRAGDGDAHLSVLQGWREAR